MKGAPKIFVVEGEQANDLFGVKKALIGIAGTANDIGAINRFLFAGGPTPKIKDSMFLMLCKDGIFLSNNFADWSIVHSKVMSIGSGESYALGALEHGASPVEAIAIASNKDIYTGMGCKEYIL